jgi:thiol-disulfide isomerase/thioredoxin
MMHRIFRIALIYQATCFWTVVILVFLLTGVEIRAQPANDMFANRAILNGTNLLISADNWGASLEPGEPMSWYSSLGATVWWSWTAPLDCVCTISTAGSSFDTILGICSGDAVGNLSFDEYSDDYFADLTSRIKFDAYAGNVYQIFVDGSGGEQGNIWLRLTVGPSMVGTKAPAWSLLKPNGTRVQSSDFAGKVVILDFWATWCGPCKDEIPDFIELQDQYGADGLAVVGLSVDSLSSTVSQFLATYTPVIDYTVVMANSAVQTSYGGIEAIPTTFIIDRDNVIRKKFVGSRYKSEFVSAVAPFLYGKIDLRCGPDGSAALAWRADGEPLVLHSLKCDPSPVWREWTGTIFHDPNGTNRVSIPSAGAGFFRLQYPK